MHQSQQKGCVSAIHMVRRYLKVGQDDMLQQLTSTNKHAFIYFIAFIYFSIKHRVNHNHQKKEEDA